MFLSETGHELHFHEKFSGPSIQDISEIPEEAILTEQGDDTQSAPSAFVIEMRKVSRQLKLLKEFWFLM